jgi:hypothetical protein
MSRTYKTPYSYYLQPTAHTYTFLVVANTWSMLLKAISLVFRRIGFGRVQVGGFGESGCSFPSNLTCDLLK